MKTISLFISGILLSVALSEEITLLAGTKAKGALCFSPMECVEPLYCLKLNETAHACNLKPCGGQGECRIGQFCSKDGKCAAPDCKSDDDCAGSTVCQVNSKCSSKSNGGQACCRDGQCWSGKCSDKKCTDSDGNIVGNAVDGVVGAADSVVDGTVGNIRRIGSGGITGIVVGILTILALCCLCGFCIRKFRSRSDGN